LFGSIDESKIESTQKLDRSDKSKNIDLENLRLMHKNHLKFPAPLPKLTDNTTDVQ
jgi:hypothetical protein